jgi:hypothetical protein
VIALPGAPEAGCASFEATGTPDAGCFDGDAPEALGAAGVGVDAFDEAADAWDASNASSAATRESAGGVFGCAVGLAQDRMGYESCLGANSLFTKLSGSDGTNGWSPHGGETAPVGVVGYAASEPPKRSFRILIDSPFEAAASRARSPSTKRESYSSRS